MIGIVSVLIWASPLLVSAVRIFRVLSIPQRAAALNDRKCRKVVSRGRRTYRPFERELMADDGNIQGRRWLRSILDLRE